MASKFLSIILICLGFLTISAQEKDDVISIESNLVLLNTTITDNIGKPVIGLKKNLFSIFEDGKQQDIEVFESQETPFAAVVLIDTSGSMESRISIARSSAMNFLSGIRADDQVAVYNFDSSVKLIQDFSHSQELSERGFEIRANGMTVLYDAIYKAAQELAKRTEKRKAIVVLSDGMDTRSGRSADKALKSAIDANATIYTIDMSSIGDKDRMQSVSVLKNFAEKSGGKFIASENAQSLRNAFTNIVEELGIQYTLGYYPKNDAKDGKWRAIEVRVAKPNLTIRTRKGYNAPKK
jgi:VWFA-related protein